MNDFCLVSRIKKGDKASFTELWLRHEAYITNIIRRIIKDPEQTRDLRQDVALQLWLCIKKFRYQCRFATWLFRVVTNITLMYLRKVRHDSIRIERIADNNIDRSLSHAHKYHSPFKEFYKKEVCSHIYSEINKLKKEYGLIIHHHYLGELQFEEISKFTTSSIPALKSQSHRGREILKRRLREYSVEEYFDAVA